MEPRNGSGSDMSTVGDMVGDKACGLVTPRDRDALARETVPFRGTTRFELVRTIGAGGMGVVYEAIDRERGSRVALKTLRTASPEALLRFKDEFRSHAGVYHENLVQLGELVEDGVHWFFTMELVDGVHFLRWVGRDGVGDAGPLGAGAEQRLRDALRKLTHALRALHTEKRVHRDIKSSNVLVTGTGRVVVVDFGVVADISGRGAVDRSILGTPSAMAPEQATGAPATAASDWYAVGALLYQALTGRAPFHGSPDEIFRQKVECEPTPPSRSVRGVPPDLEALCLALLARDPATRADGGDCLRVLVGGKSDDARPAPALHSPPFVGRAAELAVLRAAYARTRGGVAVSLHIAGESGIGKSELAHRFADAMSAEGALVLAGRCYEHESVPYKAIDGIIDALARRLQELRADEVGALLFPDMVLLAQAFPVLDSVPAIAELASSPKGDGDAASDPRVLRANMFAAFRELMHRLSRRQALVLLVDDAHWADADSVELFGELMRQPGAPPLFLLSAGRPSFDEPEAAAAMRGRLTDMKRLTLEALASVDAELLIDNLTAKLDGAGTAGLDRARLSREAGGHPLYIDELVRHRLEPAHETGSEALTLDAVLWRRIARLDASPRRLLTLLAVNGQPAGQAVVAAALDVDLGELERNAAPLLGGRLIRRSGGRVADRIDVYHDRIRRAVLGHLDGAALRDAHLRLARAYEATQPDDLEILAVHWQAAGDAERAIDYTVRAARRAATVLAFDRTARLVAAALELMPADAPLAVGLRIELGDALAHGGHGPEAARAYLEASRTCDARRSLELQRRAVEQYLRCGHVDEGLAAARSVLGQVGLDVPRTALRAVLSAIWLRARVRLRGLSYRERAAQCIDEDQLVGIDVCWSMAIGLGIVDNVRGAAFQSRQLLLALRAGEPRRVARALALETAYSATIGAPGIRRARRIGAEALQLAERVGDPHTIGLALGSAGAAACLVGEWRTARTLLERGEHILHGCIGTDWELASTRVFALVACVYLGELRELERVAAYLRQARARGDLYAESTLLGRVGWIASLLADDPETARRQTTDAISRWSSIGFHTQHRFHMFASASIDVYRGDARSAYDFLAASWRSLKSSFLLHVQMARIEMLDVRGRAALAAARDASASGRRDLLRGARRDAERLAGERTAWASVLATLLRAGIAAAEGRAEQALDHLAATDRAAAEIDMSAYSMVARRRYGEIVGGDRGAAIVAAADAWLVGRGVARPDRLAALLAPRWSV